MTGPENGEHTESEFVEEIRETATRLTQVASSAATHIVGAIAGIPAATWAGAVVAGEVSEERALITSADAIAAASATGFGVVLLSSFVFAFLLVPLITAFIQTYGGPNFRG